MDFNAERIFRALPGAIFLVTWYLTLFSSSSAQTSLKRRRLEPLTFVFFLMGYSSFSVHFADIRTTFSCAAHVIDVSSYRFRTRRPRRQAAGFVKARNVFSTFDARTRSR